jgi:hypothetical protein
MTVVNVCIPRTALDGLKRLGRYLCIVGDIREWNPNNSSRDGQEVCRRHTLLNARHWGLLRRVQLQRPSATNDSKKSREIVPHGRPVFGARRLVLER